MMNTFNRSNKTNRRRDDLDLSELLLKLLRLMVVFIIGLTLLCLLLACVSIPDVERNNEGNPIVCVDLEELDRRVCLAWENPAPADPEEPLW